MQVMKTRSGEPPVAKERPSEEFVRHFHNVVKLTAGNPNRLISALDEHPGLDASLKRLGEVLLLVKHRRKYAPRRYIRNAPPGFWEALKDFEAQWTGPYNEYRDRMYMRALSRISKEFVRQYHLLIERTGNDPSAIEHPRELRAELDDPISELCRMCQALDDRRREFDRYVGEAPSEFREALGDFKERWVEALHSSGSSSDIDL
jgi:hypothetical protein